MGTAALDAFHTLGLGLGVLNRATSPPLTSAACTTEVAGDVEFGIHATAARQKEMELGVATDAGAGVLTGGEASWGGGAGELALAPEFAVKVGGTSGDSCGGEFAFVETIEGASTSVVLQAEDKGGGGDAWNEDERGFEGEGLLDSILLNMVRIDDLLGVTLLLTGVFLGVTIGVLALTFLFASEVEATAEPAVLRDLFLLG